MKSLLILALLLLLSAACIDAQLQSHALNFDGFWAAGVALDGAGSVYGSSYYGDMVYRFNASTGRLLNTLDTAFSFVAPTGLAWDPVYGGLLVADTVRWGWARLAPNSSVLPFFPLAPSLPPPTPSNNPGSVAVDPVSGSIYLGQYYGALLQAYAANGSLLWESSVYADGSAANVRGMAVDAQRVLSVADYNLGNIVQFSASGERGAVLSSAWLDQPCGVAVDAAGDVYVASYGLNAIVKFNLSGGALNEMQSFTTSNPQLYSPAGLAVDGDGYVYAGDPGNGRLVKFAPDGSVALVMTEGVVELAPSSVVYDATRDSLIVVSGTALFWVSLNGTAVTPLDTATPLTLSSAAGLAMDNFGNLLIVNAGDNQLLSVELGPDGSWTAVNAPQTQFSHSTNPGIAVDAAGNYYMADTTADEMRIMKMYNTGQLQDIFITSSPDLNCPAGVAVTPDGSLLYVADQGNGRVVQWSTAVSQTEPSQVWPNITNPVGVVLDPLGNVFVGSIGSVYQLLPDGSATVVCLPVPAPANQTIGNDYYTSFLTVDNSGNLYLADYWNNRIVVCPAAAPAPIPSSTAPPFVTSSSFITSSSSPVASSSPFITSSSSPPPPSSSTVSSSSSPSVTSSSPSATSSSTAFSSSPPSISSSSSPSSSVASSTSSPAASSSSAAPSSSSSASASSSATSISSASSPSSSPSLSSEPASSSSAASGSSSSSSAPLPTSPSSSSSTWSASSSPGVTSSSATAAISSSSATAIQASSSTAASSTPTAPAPSAPASSSSSSVAVTAAFTASSSTALTSPPTPWPPASTSAFSPFFSSSSSPAAVVVPSGSSGGLSPGAIAGIAVGGVVACCLLVLCFIIAAGRSKKGDKQRRDANDLGALEAPADYQYADVAYRGAVTPATSSMDSRSQLSATASLSIGVSPAIGNSMMGGTYELAPLRPSLVMLPNAD